MKIKINLKEWFNTLVQVITKLEFKVKWNKAKGMGKHRNESRVYSN